MKNTLIFKNDTMNISKSIHFHMNSIPNYVIWRSYVARVYLYVPVCKTDIL